VRVVSKESNQFRPLVEAQARTTRTTATANRLKCARPRTSPRQEIGVRSTLGAQRGDIVALVLCEAAVVTLVGLAVGGALSMLALRLASHLVGLDASLDAVTLVAEPLLMALVIAGACYLPARRAARVDPMVVLRGLQADTACHPARP
jgi:predicted lysophospholipase L1 biosynthesis ABC-type transport system permease subunit